MLSFLSRLFNFKKNKDGYPLHSSGEGSNNAKAKKTKKVKPKTMKKDKPNLPASAMLKGPAASKSAVKKPVAKKKSAKKMY
jgi:hypothetical protein